MRFQDLLDKGIMFPSENSPLTPQDIANLETLIQAPLPEQYRDYLLHANGGEIEYPALGKNLNGYIATIHWPKDNGIFNDDEYTIVQYLHNLQQILWYYNEWNESLPPQTLVFATDPVTTFYLIGFGPENKGKIYAWRTVEENDPEDEETSGYAYEGFMANSFVELILSLQNIDVLKQR